MSKEDESTGCLAYTVFLIAAIVLIVALFDALDSKNAITTYQAQHYFQTLSGSDDVEIVRHSDMRHVLGDRHNVVFALLIDGEPASGECTSSYHSEIICILYDY